MSEAEGTPAARPPAERIALIINPRATCSTPSVRGRVARELAPHGVEWTLITRTPADTAQMAREAIEAGATTVVTLGGDGTAADVAGVLAGTTVAFAPLPGGNANVFSRAMGWPGDIDVALDRLEEALDAHRRRSVHLGTITLDDLPPRTFIINCGIGLDAATVEWIERRPRTKRRLRHAGFALGAAIATVRARRSDTRLHVTTDEAGDPEDVATVLAACGSPYTYLRDRPLDLVPGADFSGPVRWVGVRRVGARSLSRLALGAIRGRAPSPGHPDLVMGDAGAALRISADAPMPVQADGEALGRHREIVISPGPVLTVVVPAPG
jgi:diacylglycerol kinase family enzyme